MAKQQKFTGVLVVENFDPLDQFYSQRKVSISDLDSSLLSQLEPIAFKEKNIQKWYPSTYLVLKCNEQQSALAKVSSDGLNIVPITKNNEFFGITPKNKEQNMLFDLLANESVKVISVTGKAGTGKSLLIGSYICERLMSKKVHKVVISKPMEIVGNSKYYGTVPGDKDEKFDPFLLNFKYLFLKLAGEKGSSYFEEFVAKGLIEFMPLELMRGVSFAEDTIVYLDEAQNIDDHVIKTLGTRIGEESRLIISGDYNQVDAKGKDFKPGLLKVIESEIYKRSGITGHIHLMKVERGPVAELFAEIFGEE